MAVVCGERLFNCPGLAMDSLVVIVVRETICCHSRDQVKETGLERGCIALG